jgi:hypothetical protein
LVSTSNVIVDKDFEVPAVAVVKEPIKLFVADVVDGVIGLEEGLKVTLRLFSCS